MPRKISHNQIVSYFQSLQEAHVALNHFYRFNWAEIKSDLRYGGDGFVFLMESHDGALSKASEGTATRNTRVVSFLILKSCKKDDFTAQNDAHNEAEEIGLDIISRINHDRKGVRRDDPLAWLRGFDPGNVRYEAVQQPLFLSYHGYNFIIELPNNAEIDYNAEVQSRFGA